MNRFIFGRFFLIQNNIMCVLTLNTVRKTEKRGIKSEKITPEKLKSTQKLQSLICSYKTLNP